MNKIKTIVRFAYSVDEVAAMTSLSKAFLRKEIRSGRLESQRVGRRVIILTDAIERFLVSGTTAKAPEQESSATG